MSSFIGHSLAGITTYAIGHQLQLNHQNHSKKNSHNWFWLGWLMAIASIPDIDYLIPIFKVQYLDQSLRITHSFVGVLLVPAMTMLMMWLSGNRGEDFKIKSYQLIIVGLSHLFLDTLTGVYPKPWLYPFSLETFKLPFGILPSAGRIDLNNYLLYRNLIIELGVLVPLSISLILSVSDADKRSKHKSIMWGGLLISSYFMFRAFSLAR